MIFFTLDGDSTCPSPSFDWHGGAAGAVGGNLLWPLGKGADGTLGSDKTLPLSEPDLAYRGHPSVPPRDRKPHLAKS